ncbi:hypothetical protein GV829_04585 [Sphingomonas lacunae]|uniref:Uncharacterized protein n=1 Tax=Sphingomonas lacunae TaxID=2698828 RepID=A0A6M4ATZ9_9SPHN|nr:hypothetical protein [Sphingomonas lacunae]QJQ31812.1 hypothetical protein GV829_04585 [Sphingomonas lacunae]
MRPERIPAVLTITIRDSGKVHRFAIPNGMVPARLRSPGRRRRAGRA